MNEKIFDDKVIQDRIDEIIKKFPINQPKSSIIESLLILQEKKNGYVSEPIMKQLSDYLKVELIDVMEVATFYSMINTKPVGKNVISVCNNVSCMLNGSDEIIKHIEKKLRIKVGMSTSDKKFYLKDAVECLAACTGAPMMQVNHVNDANLTKEQLKFYALMIGADCPFFIENTPMLVEGVGEKLKNIKLNLDAYDIKVYSSDIRVSTVEAYSLIKSFKVSNLRHNIKKHINTWQENIFNNFEEPIFQLYPKLKEKKRKIIEDGALYCSMSGTGSSIYAIYKK